MILVLPEEIKVFLTFLVTQGLKALFNLFGKDFEGVAAGFVAAVVAIVLFGAETLLGLVPDEYKEPVGAALSFIVALLGAFGVHYSYRNIGS